MKRTCKGCLWNWLAPANLPPGCYCKESPKYHEAAQGGCRYYVAGLKDERMRKFVYSESAMRTVKVYHNKRVMK